MARRITSPTAPRSTSTRNSNSSSNRPSLKEIFSSLQMWVQTYEFRLCSGIILSVITLMLVVAFISFFFTGGHDYSIVVQPEARQAMRNEIQNALGLPGAVIARWLVDGTFGIASLAALVALALYSIRLIMYFPLRRLRLLFIVLFILVWGPSIQYCALNVDWQLVSYMILDMFQCPSPKSSHPLPLQQSP